MRRKGDNKRLIFGRFAAVRPTPARIRHARSLDAPQAPEQSARRAPFSAATHMLRPRARREATRPVQKSSETRTQVKTINYICKIKLHKHATPRITPANFPRQTIILWEERSYSSASLPSSCNSSFCISSCAPQTTYISCARSTKSSNISTVSANIASPKGNVSTCLAKNSTAKNWVKS